MESGLCQCGAPPKKTLWAALDNHRNSSATASSSSSKSCRCDWETLCDVDWAVAPEGEATIDMGGATLCLS
eukprot:CAMPEP_0170895306 /NCGR_PEP_ID=MMETSP0734-20130129/43870_1 /TAXON_ID=186038 /ORGANISM="Fragilariopsis kerguelensis, Strain L26-C5" /LENGTH=70 /DNA_ID=CAMNT_0011286831 /DNA_START=52 /DNA_END=264 /DNA_ORIENTATION=+